ncbi:MAG: alpha/beta hydrolase [Alphaproteobacteria bacterium]|nr:alpha/beta hydrolase [Alphaproteobacteria bacterium]
MAIREVDYKLDGINVHAYAGGKGFPLLLLHGSGPGASSFGNWHAVMGPLAERYKILAGDLIGFGKSGQKKREPYFDIGLWMKEAQFLLEKVAPRGPVGVIGHSLSGFLTLRLAARNPRIVKVLVTGSLGAKYKIPNALVQGWTFPPSEAAFKKFYSQMVADTSLMTPQFLKDRMRVLNTGNYRDYFTKMFKGDKQKILDQCVLTPAELKKIKCEVLMVHGAQDRPVPFAAAAVPLADKLPQSDLVRLANCGHGPAMDRPKLFLELTRNFFG